MTDTRILAMLLTLCVGTFVATSSGSALAPFLRLIAADLKTDLATVAHLFGFMSVTWGSASLCAGFVTDRIGRKKVLVIALAMLGVARLLFANAQSYPAIVVWQLVSGASGGAFMGTVFATVSDHVQPAKRGRSLSWIITGQSLSLLMGVPLITWLGSVAGWRGGLAAHGAVTVACALLVWWVVPRSAAVHHEAHRTKVPLKQLLRPRLLAFLLAGTTERVCFALVGMFIAAYLQHVYGIQLRELAVALALIASGTLAGNVVGGRLADGVRSRPMVFAASSLATALVAAPTFIWHGGLVVSVALGFLYSFANALGRPSLLATLSDVPSELRGALFGIQIATASVGWLLAASIGAVLIAASEFAGLGILAASVALLGAALAWISDKRFKET
jgi:MFS transporter, DHA1 family, inner membrane transport protein